MHKLQEVSSIPGSVQQSYHNQILSTTEIQTWNDRIEEENLRKEVEENML